MTTWNQQGGYYPPPPDQGYGAYPPQAPFPGTFPPQGGYPAPGGYPPQPGPPPAGFMQGPAYGGPPMGGQMPPQDSGMYGGTSHDIEGDVKGFDFTDRTIRQAFIRKVYSILMIQLLITVAFIALFLYHEPSKRYVHSHPELWWVALVTMIISLIAMACCGDLRRKPPQNFIFLALFTFSEAFMLSMAASLYDESAVLLAVGITAAVCLGLTLFAFQTKWDFTVMRGALLVCAIVLMVFGLIAMIAKVKILTLIYASLGALLFSFYLIYDTQVMLGGTHKYAISPEEYIFAALNLYLDIINIFLYILTIIGASRD